MEKPQQRALENVRSKDITRYESFRLRKLGFVALDGYTILPEAVNINESIRDKMEGRVIGQPAAIDAIVEAMDRREARLQSDSKPIANFAFLGPTGVGKTETAKALAEAIAPEEMGDNLIRIDCSEYNERHQVNRLLGAPPGYVGYGHETVLNKDNVKENTVILFDEIEKAHPKLYDTLLQIMDDGRLETGNGQQLSFRDSVIIMTSNLGADRITEHLKGGGLGFAFDNGEPNMEKIEQAANSSFAKKFRPEFIGRLTKQVVFHPLDKESMGSILDVKVNSGNEEYESYDECFSVSLSDKTKESIVDEAMKNSHEGARPLVKVYESKIQALLGRYHGSGMIEHGSRIRIFHRDEAGRDGQNPDMPELVFTAKHDEVLIEENYYKRQKREDNNLQLKLAAMESRGEHNPFRPITS